MSNYNYLQQTINNIKPLDGDAMTAVANTLTRRLPNGADIGYLKDILVKYAGITASTTIVKPRKYSIITCADHGVAALKLSAYPVETTVQMTRNYLISKGAVANALSNFARSTLAVVDMGIAAPMDKLAGLIDKKIAYGTKNCTVGPAMSREQALQSITTGIELAADYAANHGCRCFLPGEMGIANTTSSAAIVAVLCGLSAEQATGRGTNISDERLRKKIAAVELAISVNKPDSNDGLDVLAKVGGFELGCITGIILGAAANHACVVIDGFNTAAAALIANAICPLTRDYLIGSHLAAEPAHINALNKLGVHPFMDMRFRLGESTGSSIAVNLLDATIDAYNALTNETAAAAETIPLAALDSDGKPVAITPLNQTAMDACRLYIDNLTKPIHSLGRLEDLGVKIAGVTGNAKPGFLRKSLIAFVNGADRSGVDAPLTAAFAGHASASLTAYDTQNIDRLTLQEALATARSIVAGQRRGQSIVVAVANCDPAAAAYAHQLLNDRQEYRGRELAASLLTAAPASFTLLVGVILAAAEQRCLVVLDDHTVQVAAIIAQLLEPVCHDYLFCPEIAPGSHQTLLANALRLPDYLDLDFHIGGGCAAALGCKIIDAALHMINDMKTFGQADVAVANDGPGADRQDLAIQ